MTKLVVSAGACIHAHSRAFGSGELYLSEEVGNEVAGYWGGEDTNKFVFGGKRQGFKVSAALPPTSPQTAFGKIVHAYLALTYL